MKAVMFVVVGVLIATAVGVAVVNQSAQPRPVDEYVSGWTREVVISRWAPALRPTHAPPTRRAVITDPVDVRRWTSLFDSLEVAPGLLLPGGLNCTLPTKVEVSFIGPSSRPIVSASTFVGCSNAAVWHVVVNNRTALPVFDQDGDLALAINSALDR